MTTADLIAASVPLQGERIIGLSSDTKPDDVNPVTGADLQAGETFYAEDTGQEWYWTGSAWVLVTFPQMQERSYRLQLEIRDLLQAIIR